MLILSRRLDEVITIYPDNNVDPEQRVCELAPIEIQIRSIKGRVAVLAIHAPQQLKVWRGKPPPEECLPTALKATSKVPVG
jgi:sRNA-binding carbon storage regulator CsrA